MNLLDQDIGGKGSSSSSSSSNNRGGGGGGGGVGEVDDEGRDGREQDRFLPVANIARIMKVGLNKGAKFIHLLWDFSPIFFFSLSELNLSHQSTINNNNNTQRVLPANEKISKEAKEAVQECVSEFISFITSEASDRCQQEKRKTINGEDLLWAMGTLGFDEYGGPLKIYLQVQEDTSKWTKNENYNFSEFTHIPCIVSEVPRSSERRATRGFIISCCIGAHSFWPCG